MCITAAGKFSTAGHSEEHRTRNDIRCYAVCHSNFLQMPQKYSVGRVIHFKRFISTMIAAMEQEVGSCLLIRSWNYNWYDYTFLTHRNTAVKRICLLTPVPFTSLNIGNTRKDKPCRNLKTTNVVFLSEHEQDHCALARMSN